MSGSRSARDALAAVVHGQLGREYLPPRLRDALAEAAMEGDLVELARRAAAAMLEAEAFSGACRNVHGQLRDAIQAALEDTGMGRIDLDAHTISLTEGGAGFAITDAAAVPSDLKRAFPDRDAIKRALAAGRDVPGVSLTNNPPHITVRAKRSNGR